ncbi:hypothetical protein V2J09_002117 [Rumex salicifolius]
MTEYWVSQGNKWCDFCKIFLSNNPATIRNHELGQRHKDNVAKRLTDMRKEKADKDKKEKEAVKALEQIEAKAEKSYQKDKVSFQKAGQARAPCLDDTDGRDWEYDSSSGIHYDPNSGFYYSDILGKWVTQEEAFAAVQKSGGSKQKEPLKKPLATPVNEKKDTVKSQGSSASFNPTNRSFKGAATSSVAVQKRKRPVDKKPKTASPEETAALKAREAARRRVEDREKSLLGLYQH